MYVCMFAQQTVTYRRYDRSLVVGLGFGSLSSIHRPTSNRLVIGFSYVAVCLLFYSIFTSFILFSLLRRRESSRSLSHLLMSFL